MDLSDLHVKIIDILSKYLSDVSISQEDAIALADELANLLSVRVRIWVGNELVAYDDIGKRQEDIGE